MEYMKTLNIDGSENPDIVLKGERRAVVQRGDSPEWQAFESWLAEGNIPDPFSPPPPIEGAAPSVVVIPKLELYRRMTDEEYDRMQDQGLATQSKRIQDIFLRVDKFRSDDSLWPLLLAMGHQLYGDERTAELLAAP